MKTITANPKKHNYITPCQAKNKTFLLGKMVRILRKRPFHRKIVNYNAPH